MKTTAQTRRRIWTLVGGLIIVAALALLVAVASRGNLTYYYTVAEIRQAGQAGGVRVAGALVAGSIEEGALGQAVSFRIEDAGHPETGLTVVYEGPIPDNLRVEGELEVVVEGDYEGGDLFAASHVLTKCPSKYEGAAERKVRELEDLDR